MKLHPDRHGDRYLAEFEALQTAYNVLKDPETRETYIDTMLEVIKKCQVMDNRQVEYLLERTHENLIVRDMKKKEQEGSNFSRYKQKMEGTRKPMAIETTMFNQPPRALHASRVGYGTTVAVDLPPLHQHQEDLFRNACRSITIYNKDEAVHKLKGERLKEAFAERGWIKTVVQLGAFGNAELSWTATLYDSSCVTTTPRSEVRNITLESKEAVLARQQLPGLEIRLSHLLGKMNSALRELPGVLSLNKSDAELQEMERKYWDLHNLISKGRTLARNYLDSYRALGYDEGETLEQNKNIRELLRCTDECCMKKSELDSLIQHNQKRRSMKSFKHSIASLIEDGTLDDWVLTVQKEEMVNTGGEANRLYQLLIEGKKANSLLLDSTSLQNASTRNDLFSDKQCKALVERASEVEARMIEETEKLVKEHAEVEKAEKLRQEMEKRAQLMPLRTHIVLQGLQKTEWNGLPGIFMGVASDSDRYIIRVQGSDFAFKKEN